MKRNSIKKTLLAGLLVSIAILAAMVPAVAFAGTSITINGSGSGGGYVIANEGSVTGAIVAGYYPTSGMSAWVQGSSAITVDPTKPYKTSTRPGFVWSSVLAGQSGALLSGAASARVDIQDAADTGIFWYQVYIVGPRRSDVNADGLLPDGTKVPVDFTSYAPRWGIYENSTYSEHTYWRDAGWGTLTGNNYYGLTDGERGLATTGKNSTNWTDGGQRPIWNTAGARNYSKPKVAASGYVTMRTGSTTKDGSEITVNVDKIVNNPKEFEGRYALFGHAFRARGQANKVNNTMPLSRSKDGFKLIRPRVRLTVLNAATKQPIGSATWDMGFNSTDTSLETNIPSGGLRGSSSYATIDASSSFADVKTAAKAPAVDTTAGVFGKKVLPCSLVSKTILQDYNLSATVPGPYYFDSSAINSINYYSMNELDKATPTPQTISLPTGTLSNTNKTITFNDVKIGFFDGDIAAGGLYDIVVYAQPGGGPDVSGIVFNDSDKSTAWSSGDTINTNPNEIVFVLAGADPTNQLNYIDNVPIISTGGNYSKTFPVEYEDKKVDVYIKVFNPEYNWNNTVTRIFNVNEDVSKTITGFMITKPQLQVGAPADSEGISLYHVARLTLQGSIRQDFGLYFPEPDKKKTPPKITTTIDAPQNWLNSNRPAIIRYSPTAPTVTRAEGKIITAQLVHAELFLPANEDWAYYRTKTSNRNIQPVYTNVMGNSIQVDATWRQENADVASKNLTIVVPNALLPGGTFTAGEWTNVFNGGKFIYTTTATDSNSDLEVRGTMVDASSTITNWTSSGATNGGVAGLLNFPGKYIQGSTASNGGTTYYGIAGYHIQEISIIDGVVLFDYYEFGDVAVKNIKVYSSVGTN